MKKRSMRFSDVFEARRRIAGIAVRTPTKVSLNAARYGFRALGLKMETMQATGAFKLRGAANAVLSLSKEKRMRGIVTASSGNHGRAVAYVANFLDIPATVCLSELADPAKVRAIEAMGVEVIVGGADQDAAMIEARRIEADRGATYIDPFDDPDVIAGQATIGLEMLEDDPDLDVIFVPVSGGGLAGGVAFAAKAINPQIRVVGVSMERGAAMHDSLKAGRPMQVAEQRTLADALQGGIGLDNKHTFDLCRRYLDDFVLLTEDEIERCVRTAFYDERLVLEGAGACGFGAITQRAEEYAGAKAATVCSGDNIDPEAFKRLIE